MLVTGVSSPLPISEVRKKVAFSTAGWFWRMFAGPPKPERGYKKRNDGIQNCNDRTKLGTRKRGHYESGLFTGGISRISTISRFSGISRKWLDSPLFSRVWGFSKISRVSN